jgi:thioredoxin reductase (NADPH)
MVDKIKEYDVIVLGAGPGGLTAGIYASRYRLKVLILSKNLGGMMNYAEVVENYPGFTGSGMELAEKFTEQARKFGCEILQQGIVDIGKEKTGRFIVQTSENRTFKAKSIIIASGTERRKLHVKGEENLLGKGVSYCAICDAPLFKGKVVAVIGGRNSAAHAALLLAKYAVKVYIVYRRDKLRCDELLLEEVKKQNNIEVIYNALPSEIHGKDKVEKLVIEVRGKKQEMPLDGIFIEIGGVPITSLAEKVGIKIDDRGYIIVDKDMRTNVDGVFAAGDVTQNSLKQIITAAAEGAIAANSANRFLKGINQ